MCYQQSISISMMIFMKMIFVNDEKEKKKKTLKAIVYVIVA